MSISIFTCLPAGTTRTFRMAISARWLPLSSPCGLPQDRLVDGGLTSSIGLRKVDGKSNKTNNGRAETFCLLLPRIPLAVRLLSYSELIRVLCFPLPSQPVCQRRGLGLGTKLVFVLFHYIAIPPLFPLSSFLPSLLRCITTLWTTTASR